MERIDTDICVIGAGSGGLSVAAGAVQMGARVVLVEGDHMGGDCLNTGCVPSKALIASAGVAETVRGAAGYGVRAGAAEVDFAAVMARVRAVIGTIAPVDSQERFEGLGCRVLRGWARFSGPREVVVGEVTVRARRFVIATGSRAVVPDIPGLGSVPYMTNETVFSQGARPAHLLVLGGGPIGIEMAQAHRRLGSEVTVIEAGRCLGREDPAAAEIVLERLRAEGVAFATGAGAVRVRDAGPGVEVVLADGRIVTGSHLLVAVGRKPALERLDLVAGGVEFGVAGVTVGAGLRSVSNRRVYVVGDAAGQGQFTHLAAYHAGIVVRQAVLGLPARLRSDHIPRVTFSEPELAQAGPIEEEARKAHGDGLQVLRADFAHNDRAITAGQTEGFVKLLVVKGRVVGATIVGAGAGEVLAALALAVSARIKVSALAGVVLPYPTFAEAVKRAAGSYYTPTLFGPRIRAWVRFVQRLP